MNSIEIYEVGPRDGFQNIREFIPTHGKLQIIDQMAWAGLRHIQATSFVSPKAIPQMRDAQEIVEHCLKQHPHCDFFALVPNLRGAASAWDAGLRKVSYVVSLSASHNKANINRTHQESLAEFQAIVSAYPELEVCVDLATAFGCPFEGKMYADEVVGFVKDYADGGLKSLNLCDTIGIADPKQVRETIKAVRDIFPQLDLQIHIHDTRNMGMVNTLAAIECGITKVQSTLGGLGGCPFAPGASGNLATEDLAYMLIMMGYELGVDLRQLIEAAKLQLALIPDGVFSGHHIRIPATVYSERKN